jgi:predicted nucleotidyltransferase
MKLENSLKEVLVYLSGFFQQQDVPFVVIGALAPVLMIDFLRKNSGPYGSRITLDVDMSVRVHGWKEYDSLKKELIKSGFLEKAGAPEHRLFYKDTFVDLIPYDRSLISDNILVWPKSGFRMNMRGFQKIFQNAQPVQIEEGISVPVIPVPLSILLKIETWLDRYELHDLEDIVYMLDQYETVEVSERRFEVLASETLSYENSGAYLAGADLKTYGIPDIKAMVRPFFKKFPDADAPPLFAVASRLSKKPEDILQLIQAFQVGIGIKE